MAKYKLKEGVKCYPFGEDCKEVVNVLSTEKDERGNPIAEKQVLLNDSMAEFLISSGRLTIDAFEVTESKQK